LSIAADRMTHIWRKRRKGCDPGPASRKLLYDNGGGARVAGSMGQLAGTIIAPGILRDHMRHGISATILFKMARPTADE